jgi:hypothetical protein
MVISKILRKEQGQIGILTGRQKAIPQSVKSKDMKRFFFMAPFDDSLSMQVEVSLRSSLLLIRFKSYAPIILR